MENRMNFFVIIVFFVPYSTVISQHLNNEFKGNLDGDLILGGLFPLHAVNTKGECLDKINFDGIFMLEAFYFSIQQANLELKSCCGFTLGAITYDTCSSPRYGLFKAIELILPEGNKFQPESLVPVVGVVGPYSSSVTIQVANLLSMFKVIQISYGATSPQLSFRDKFPLFFRTVPSDEGHAEILMAIMKKMSWTYISAIYEDTPFGKGAFAFMKLAYKNGLCFAHTEELDEDSPDARNITYYKNLLRKLYNKAPMAHTVVLYLSSELARFVFRAAKLENLGSHFTFVGADGWGGKFIEPDIREVTEGSIISHHVKRNLPNFKEHFFKLHPFQYRRKDLNPWFTQFWEEALKCVVKGSKTEARFLSSSAIPPTTSINDVDFDEISVESNVTSLFNTTQPPIIYCEENADITNGIIDGTEFDFVHYVRDAVFAYATALKNMYSDLCAKRGRHYFCFEMKRHTADLNIETNPQYLMEYLENVTFPVANGPDFKFVNKQDGPRNYSIFVYAKNKEGVYYWKEMPIQLENSTQSIAAMKFGRKYPESVCGLNCPPGSIRHIKPNSQDRCCWDCHPCPFPEIATNQTHCQTCNSIDYDQPMVYRRPNVHNNGCMEMESVSVGYDNYYFLGAVALSAVGVLLTFVIAGTFIYHINTPVVKASARELSAVLLTGILLCYTTVFLLGLRPSVTVCASVRFMYSISYTVCYAAIFLKTNRIERIFNRSSQLQSTGNEKSIVKGESDKSRGPRPKRRLRKAASNVGTNGNNFALRNRTKYISPLSQMFLVVVIVGFQVVLNAVWMFLKVPGPDYMLVNDIETRTVQVYIFCEAFEDQDMMVALTLPIILLILSVLYAFKTRKIPGHFNETRYIIIATYTTFILWIAFLPLFFATEKIDLRIFALAAAQAINATVTLICMFGPKLYIVLFRPHKNTKESVMGQTHRKKLWRWSISQDNKMCTKCPRNNDSGGTIDEETAVENDLGSFSTLRKPIVDEENHSAIDRLLEDTTFVDDDDDE